MTKIDKPPTPAQMKIFASQFTEDQWNFLNRLPTFKEVITEDLELAISIAATCLVRFGLEMEDMNIPY